MRILKNIDRVKTAPHKYLLEILHTIRFLLFFCGRYATIGFSRIILCYNTIIAEILNGVYSALPL